MSTAAGAPAVYALVLAGARASGDPLCEAEGVESKALIDILGEPMLARVLRALSKSQRVCQPAYVSGLTAPLLERARGQTPVQAAACVAGGPASSLLGAIEQGLTLPLLVTTCDHALLTPAMVDHFLAAAIEGRADLTVAFAGRDTVQPAYPETKRTYLNFGGEPLSGCNLFYIAAPAALKVIGFWKSAEQDRKQPWRIAWRFGPLTALRILIGRPGVQRVFELISSRMGARIAVVKMPFAEAAIDVDSPGDLILVRSILLKRST
ncbi:MAG: nucleotidyltransferase family protein [Hyphomonas sp.]|uniref:nucleotidyltransferase family protein n=1 Tax=Hyphomonas sp. TaxID=87 RepID=UPI0034A06EDF